MWPFSVDESEEPASGQQQPFDGGPVLPLAHVPSYDETGDEGYLSSFGKAVGRYYRMATGVAERLTFDSPMREARKDIASMMAMGDSLYGEDGSDGYTPINPIRLVFAEALDPSGSLRAEFNREQAKKSYDMQIMEEQDGESMTDIGLKRTYVRMKQSANALAASGMVPREDMERLVMELEYGSNPSDWQHFIFNEMPALLGVDPIHTTKPFDGGMLEQIGDFMSMGGYVSSAFGHEASEGSLSFSAFGEQREIINPYGVGGAVIGGLAGAAFGPAGVAIGAGLLGTVGTIIAPSFQFSGMANYFHNRATWGDYITNQGGFEIPYLGVAELYSTTDGSGVSVLGHRFEKEGRSAGAELLVGLALDIGTDPTSFLTFGSGKHMKVAGTSTVREVIPDAPSVLTLTERGAHYYKLAAKKLLPQMTEEAGVAIGTGLDGPLLGEWSQRIVETMVKDLRLMNEVAEVQGAVRWSDSMSDRQFFAYKRRQLRDFLNNVKPEDLFQETAGTNKQDLFTVDWTDLKKTARDLSPDLLARQIGAEWQAQTALSIAGEKHPLIGAAAEVVLGFTGSALQKAGETVLSWTNNRSLVGKFLDTFDKYWDLSPHTRAKIELFEHTVRNEVEQASYRYAEVLGSLDDADRALIANAIDARSGAHGAGIGLASTHRFSDHIETAIEYVQKELDLIHQAEADAGFVITDFDDFVKSQYATNRTAKAFLDQAKDWNGRDSVFVANRFAQARHIASIEGGKSPTELISGVFEEDVLKILRHRKAASVKMIANREMLEHFAIHGIPGVLMNAKNFDESRSIIQQWASTVSTGVHKVFKADQSFSVENGNLFRLGFAKPGHPKAAEHNRKLIAYLQMAPTNGRGGRFSEEGRKLAKEIGANELAAGQNWNHLDGYSGQINPDLPDNENAIYRTSLPKKLKFRIEERPFQIGDQTVEVDYEVDLQTAMDMLNDSSHVEWTNIFKSEVIGNTFDPARAVNFLREYSRFLGHYLDASLPGFHPGHIDTVKEAFRRQFESAPDVEMIIKDNRLLSYSEFVEKEFPFVDPKTVIDPQEQVKAIRANVSLQGIWKSAKLITYENVVGQLLGFVGEELHRAASTSGANRTIDLRRLVPGVPPELVALSRTVMEAAGVKTHIKKASRRDHERVAELAALAGFQREQFNDFIKLSIGKERIETLDDCDIIEETLRLALNDQRIVDAAGIKIDRSRFSLANNKFVKKTVRIDAQTNKPGFMYSERRRDLRRGIPTKGDDDAIDISNVSLDVGQKYRSIPGSNFDVEDLTSSSYEHPGALDPGYDPEIFVQEMKLDSAAKELKDFDRIIEQLHADGEIAIDEDDVIRMMAYVDDSMPHIFDQLSDSGFKFGSQIVDKIRASKTKLSERDALLTIQRSLKSLLPDNIGRAKVDADLIDQVHEILGSSFDGFDIYDWEGMSRADLRNFLRSKVAKEIDKIQMDFTSSELKELESELKFMRKELAKHRPILQSNYDMLREALRASIIERRNVGGIDLSRGASIVEDSDKILILRQQAQDAEKAAIPLIGAESQDAVKTIVKKELRGVAGVDLQNVKKAAQMAELADGDSNRIGRALKFLGEVESEVVSAVDKLMPGKGTEFVLRTREALANGSIDSLRYIKESLLPDLIKENDRLINSDAAVDRAKKKIDAIIQRTSLDNGGEMAEIARQQVSKFIEAYGHYQRALNKKATGLRNANRVKFFRDELELIHSSLVEAIGKADADSVTKAIRLAPEAVKDAIAKYDNFLRESDRVTGKGAGKLGPMAGEDAPRSMGGASPKWTHTDEAKPTVEASEKFKKGAESPAGTPAFDEKVTDIDSLEKDYQKMTERVDYIDDRVSQLKEHMASWSSFISDVDDYRGGNLSFEELAKTYEIEYNFADAFNSNKSSPTIGAQVKNGILQMLRQAFPDKVKGANATARRNNMTVPQRMIYKLDRMSSNDIYEEIMGEEFQNFLESIPAEVASTINEYISTSIGVAEKHMEKLIDLDKTYDRVVREADEYEEEIKTLLEESARINKALKSKPSKPKHKKFIESSFESSLSNYGEAPTTDAIDKTIGKEQVKGIQGLEGPVGPVAPASKDMGVGTKPDMKTQVQLYPQGARPPSESAPESTAHDLDDLLSRYETAIDELDRIIKFEASGSGTDPFGVFAKRGVPSAGEVKPKSVAEFDVYLPENVAASFEEAFNQTETKLPWYAKRILSGFDAVQAFFKVNMLMPFAGYWGKNAIGNASLAITEVAGELLKEEYAKDYLNVMRYIVSTERDMPGVVRSAALRKAAIDELGNRTVKTAAGDIPVKVIVDQMRSRGTLRGLTTPDVFDQSIARRTKGSYQGATLAGFGTYVAGQAAQGATNAAWTWFYDDETPPDLSNATDYASSMAMIAGAIIGGRKQVFRRAAMGQPILSRLDRVTGIAQGSWRPIVAPMEAATELPFRAAVYLKGLKDSGSHYEGMNLTFKHLNNWHSLSGFEKSVMGRIFPFYKWTKFALEYSGREAVESPGKIASVIKIHEAFMEKYDIQDDRSPDWLKNRLQAVVEFEDDSDGESLSDKEIMSIYGFGHPIEEVAEIAGSIRENKLFHTLAGRAAFGISSAIELATDYDIRSGTISSQGDGPSRFVNGRSFEKAPQWMKLLVGYQPESDINRQAVMNPRIAWALGEIPGSRAIMYMQKAFEAGESGVRVNTRSMASTLLGPSGFVRDESTGEVFQNKAKINALSDLLRSANALGENKSITVYRRKMY